MKKLKLTTLCATAAALALGSLSAADKALVDTLVSSGHITRDQAERLLSKDAASFTAKGKETTAVRFNGRLHYQYDHLESEANDGDKGTSNHFYFRRIRLGAKAKLSDGWYAETVLEFGGDEAPELGFDKVFIGYKASDMAQFAFGFKKVPFGLEETESSAKIPTIERSAANRFFADDIDFSVRHSGLHVKGDLEGGFSYAAAFVNGIQGEGSRLGGTSNGDTNFAYYGSLRWDGELSDNISLLAGADYGVQGANEVVGGDVDVATIYAKLGVANVNLTGEYFTGTLEGAGAGGSDADPTGYAIRLSAKFGDIEPVIRYAHLDSDGFGIDEDELIRRAAAGVTAGDDEIDSLYLGFVYYIKGNSMKFMAGYEYAETEGDGGEEVEISGLRTRLQLLW